VCLDHRSVRLRAWRCGIAESHQIGLTHSHIPSTPDQLKKAIPMVRVNYALSGAISLLADSMEVR
jgi:hypothetical protein